MENLVPLGTGNSRLMKSNIPANTTLAQLIQMWNNGTFPYDIGPLNSAGISQQGTPLNKATLLKDATAALYGLGSDAVPDDVLAWLGKYNQYWWRRRLPSGLWYVESKQDFTTYHDIGHPEATSYYAKSIYVSPTSGAITLNNAINCTVDKDSTNVNSIGQLLAANAPCYYQTTYNGTYLYYIPAGATYDALSNTSTIRKVSGYLRLNYGVSVQATEVKATQRTSEPGDWEYIWSTDRSAYPDSGTQDGYEYEYLGIPFDNAAGAPKVETGSYVGTGTKGPNNPCSVTFNFVPKFVAVIGTGSWLFLRQGIKGNYPGSGGNGGVNNVVTSGMDDKTITWYVNNTSTKNYEQYQCNMVGVTYNYIALG